MATDAKTGQAIFGRYNVGLHNVGSYQVSGIPWITGSVLVTGEEHKISFPKVTKNITVMASGAYSNGEVRIAFDSNSNPNVEGSHRYLTLDTHEDSWSLPVKCKEVYIYCKFASTTDVGYELVAELTNIPTGSMYVHSGSGINNAAGLDI